MIRREGAMAVCPECEADVEIDEYDVDKGEVISCPECGVELEVVGLSPLQLDLAAQEEEDWNE
jgi:alpha-aminoadipate carrier protein LysW